MLYDKRPATAYCTSSVSHEEDPALRELRCRRERVFTALAATPGLRRLESGVGLYHYDPSLLLRQVYVTTTRVPGLPSATRVKHPSPSSAIARRIVRNPAEACQLVLCRLLSIASNLTVSRSRARFSRQQYSLSLFHSIFISLITF